MPKIQSLIDKFESLSGGMGCATRMKENTRPMQSRKNSQVQSKYELSEIQKRKQQEQPISLPDSIKSDYKRYCSEVKNEYFKASPTTLPKFQQDTAPNMDIQFPRRKSAVELVKPSRLFKDTSNMQEAVPTTSNEKTLNFQPKRVTGPLYESRRNSYSSVKPSELNFNCKKKSLNIVIKETDENNNSTCSDESNKTMSWIAKRKVNNLIKPSAVRSVENSNRLPSSGTRRFNAADITNHVLNWCQTMTKDYKNVEIKNWSSSWSDGLAFSALIHHFFPHAFDYASLNSKNREQNFKIAFDTAEKHGNIAPLLDVEDMVKFDKPDSKCVYCYVSTIYSKLSKHKLANK